MKKIMKIAALALALSLAGCVTPQPAKAPYGDKVEVIKFPGQKAGPLYSASKIWVAKAFTDANSVIQYADPATGSIVGKGNTAYPCDGFADCTANGSAVLKFTMKIDTKDEKARITFSNVTFYRPASVTAGVVYPATEVPLNTDILQQRGDLAFAGVAKRYQAEVLSAQSDAQTTW